MNILGCGLRKPAGSQGAEGWFRCLPPVRRIQPGIVSVAPVTYLPRWLLFDNQRNRDGVNSLVILQARRKTLRGFAAQNVQRIIQRQDRRV